MCVWKSVCIEELCRLGEAKRTQQNMNAFMKCDLCGGTVIDREVSYTIEFKERRHIIEHVPAKECLQCGERLYSPETVEKIQKAIWQNQKPDRYIETPVIDYVSIG